VPTRQRSNEGRWRTLFSFHLPRRFKEGVPIPYHAAFDNEQFLRLKEGLIPKQMEDKWFIYYDEPHLFLHRSWTGQPVYRVMLKQAGNGVQVTETLLSKDLANTSEDGGLSSATNRFPGVKSSPAPAEAIPGAVRSGRV
jgi:hypothetical protein